MIKIELTIDPTKSVYEQLLSQVEVFRPVTAPVTVSVVDEDYPNVQPTPTPKPKRTRKTATLEQVATKTIVTAMTLPDPNQQDSADETAEVASDVLTHDDVRSVVGDYTKRFGIASAQKKIPVILGCPIADIPDDQESLQAAIDKIQNEMSDGPDVIEDTPLFADDLEDEVTEQDVRDALMLYAKTYDVDAKMTNTLIDGPEILKKTFGPSVTALRLIPKDPASYKKALKAITEATEQNWFKRNKLKVV